MQKKNLVIALYSTPVLYPPTLNAINELAPCYNKIQVLCRAKEEKTWAYPKNVTLVFSEEKLSTKEQIEQPIFRKIQLFRKFAKDFQQLIERYQPEVVLIYDGLPLYAFSLIRKKLKNQPFLWYHNHDVFEKTTLKKFSLNWWAARAEPKMFPYIDLFTLPTDDRKKYFPINNLKGKYMLLPNFPAKRFYEQFRTQKTDPRNLVKLIYQGMVSNEHGLEEIIELLSVHDRKPSISLTIIGPGREHYRQQLKQLIAEKKVGDKVQLLDPVPYNVLPTITAQHHIGVAINKPIGIIYQTGGTASNKIYEYAAMSLPILYFDNEHYNAHLKKYVWAFETNLSKQSLLQQVNTIADRYSTFSEAAFEEFQSHLNFEKSFQNAIDFITPVQTVKTHS